MHWLLGLGEEIAGTKIASTYLESCPHSWCEGLDGTPNFHNNTGSLVACTSGAESAHLGERPVVQHEMDIGMADAGCIELDEDFIGLCSILSAPGETLSLAIRC